MTISQERPVSLIIPTYLREEHLVTCIRCALNQQYRNLEILVIDQTVQHTESTRNYLDSVKDQIKLIIPDSPPSAVTARNIGLRKSKGDILIFIDDDTEFQPDFIHEHVAVHERGAHVVQGRVIEAKGGVANLPPWIQWHCKVTGSNTCDKAGVTNSLTGCNFSISRQAADIVGEFDPNFTGSLLREDSDYGLRCWKTGMQMVFEPKAVLYHHQAPTGGVDADFTKPLRILEPSLLRNELYFVQKHFATHVQLLYQWRLMRRIKKRLLNSGITYDQSVFALVRAASKEARLLFDR